MTNAIVSAATGQVVMSEDDPPVSLPPSVSDFETAIQRHIDATARQRLYRDGNTCASYVNSTVPIWAAEAAAFVAWRDAVWEQVFIDMTEGEFTGTPAEYVVTLPVIEWPE